MRPTIDIKQNGINTITAPVVIPGTISMRNVNDIRGPNTCAQLKFKYILHAPPRRINHYGQTNACRCEPHRRNTRGSRKRNTIRRI